MASIYRVGMTMIDSSNRLVIINVWTSFSWSQVSFRALIISNYHVSMLSKDYCFWLNDHILFPKLVRLWTSSIGSKWLAPFTATLVSWRSEGWLFGSSIKSWLLLSSLPFTRSLAGLLTCLCTWSSSWAGCNISSWLNASPLLFENASI